MPPWRVAAVAVSVWLPSLMILLKVGSAVHAAAYGAILVVIVQALAVCERSQRGAEPLRRYEAGLTIAWLAAAILAFPILYAVAQSGMLGPGSDRDEALDLAIAALLRGDYPYAVRTYFGNPVTPLPGALLIGLPFHLAGGAAFQNPVALAGATVLVMRCLAHRPARALYAILLIPANLAVLQDYATGGDYAANAVYVLAAVLWGERVLSGRGAPWELPAAAIALGIATCSRPIHAVAPILVLAYGIGCGRRSPGLALGGGAALLAVALAAAFYIRDPAGFTPLHVAGKLGPYSHLAPVLAAAAALVAAVPAIRRVGPAGLIGLLALAEGVMLLPGIAVRVAAGDLAAFGFAIPIALFGGLWLMMAPLRRQPAA
ncbi:hypothetical protein [Azospirillum halopraeferens]|uniref:hypothetical protein n=1 Tax=Azospirillum halopraeferens TaxID=34010 RepID=UPI00040BA940|nr:hypothetical protein [Azospirillum halopraeferens]